jgi:hypothetical protein
MTGEMAVMTPTDGDLKIVWDSDKATETEHARKTFDEFKAKGYLAYKVNKAGDKGEVMRSFEPEAEKIILAPRMVGG